MVTSPFLISVTILCIAVLFVRKEHTIVPLIIAMCFLPADQKIQIATLDFQALRILALICIIKIYSSASNHRFNINIIDKLFISYNLLESIIYIIASQSPVNAFVYKSGVSIDSIVLYLVFRYSIKSKTDLKLITHTFALCAIILIPFVVFEFFTGQNLLSFLGRNEITMRHGEIRAAVSFSHPILFGSFAAILFPLLWANYKNEENFSNTIPLLSCIFFVYACSSSGPIVVLLLSICFLSFFRWKDHGRLLGWLILSCATVIHLIREKPIWHFLYMRLTIKASSTGAHRYRLTEAAIQEFGNWWLLGYGDAGPDWHTKYWPWTHARFTDVTNQYLLEGIRGGFFTMAIFILLCFQCVKSLASYSISLTDKNDQWLYWGFSVMMIAHCITFLSVAYFGQMTMLLYLTIAVASLTHDELHALISNNIRQQKLMGSRG